MDKKSQAIGVFDSGVGGLSILREIRAQNPAESVIYFADQGHVPYGSRTLEEVRSFSLEITRFLLKLDAKIIVVACNTASAAALHELRITFPKTSFVGMEPAIKPAAEITKTKIIGVLATPATFQGMLYASVVERFGYGLKILQDTCPGLVGQIEKGELASPRTQEILKAALIPMMEQGVDTIVLGCTHYPFIIPIVRQIVGSNIKVIDPSPAVARQTSHILEPQRLNSNDSQKGKIKFFTSGDMELFTSILPTLLGESGGIQEVDWQEGRLFIHGEIK